MDDYELTDAGDGARLERFGPYLVDRPHPGVLAARRTPGRWRDADLRFDRDRGWSGVSLAAATDGWAVPMGGLTMHLRPTDAGQVGLFPEHATALPWLAGRVAARQTDAARAGSEPVAVLHLFAYTGLATLALARDGAAVTHVDASRPTIAWARANATANGLADRPVRWIVDDAASYVNREGRRGRRYDGIVLDPPTYGHGAARRTWQLSTDLPDLLVACRAILRDDGFMLLTAHTEGVGPDRLADAVRGAFAGMGRGSLDAEPMALTATSGAILSLGASVRLDRAG